MLKKIIFLKDKHLITDEPSISGCTYMISYRKRKDCITYVIIT